MLVSETLELSALVIDDYGWWDGAKSANDEWVQEAGEQRLLFRMERARVPVKP